tara:strand:+ start:1826 stop:2023 length:198 start_codon:yes stop_codon:yes gene_type:complete
MRMELLAKKHYTHMFSKYETLYKTKFPWGGKELTDALVKCQIKTVVENMDEDEYMKEIGISIIED